MEVFVLFFVIVDFIYYVDLDLIIVVGFKVGLECFGFLICEVEIVFGMIECMLCKWMDIK